MRCRCCGNSCCLEPDEKINFNHNVEMMMPDCNFKTSTLLKSRKTAASLLKREEEVFFCAHLL